MTAKRARTSYTYSRCTLCSRYEGRPFAATIAAMAQTMERQGANHKSGDRFSAREPSGRQKSLEEETNPNFYNLSFQSSGADVQQSQIRPSPESVAAVHTPPPAQPTAVPLASSSKPPARPTIGVSSSLPQWRAETIQGTHRYTQKTPAAGEGRIESGDGFGYNKTMRCSRR